MAIHTYWPSLLVSPVDKTQCLHRTAECLENTAGRRTLVCPCVGVHKTTLLMCSSICPACCVGYTLENMHL